MPNKPIPIETRRRTGNPQHRPMGATVPVGGRVRPGDRMPDPPAHLSTAAKAVWRSLVRSLVEAGVYAKGDALALETTCGLVVRLRQVRRALDEAYVVDNPAGLFLARSVRGTIRNPLISIEAELSDKVRIALESMGLNPAGRTRLSGKNPAPKASSLGSMRESARDDASGG